MKLLVSFQKNDSKLHGRSVTARMGHEPQPEMAVVPVEVTGYCFFNGKTIPVGEFLYTVGTERFLTEKEAKEFASSKYQAEKAWFDSAEKVEIEAALSEGVESSGSTYAFDAWENRYSTIDLGGLDAAIDSVRNHYATELYQKAFFRVFEHGRFSINEMIKKGWLVEDKPTIINLTQHAATVEQVEAGVVEPENKAAVQAALTFDSIPSADEMADRSAFLARIAVDSGCKKAMIGGAPFFMAPLERALLAAGVTPVYAFSVRDSKEEPDGNGGVRKINLFRHVGFVEASQ